MDDAPTYPEDGNEKIHAFWWRSWVRDCLIVDGRVVYMVYVIKRSKDSRDY